MDGGRIFSSTLLEIIGPLFGVIIGALLAWFAARHQRIETSRVEMLDLATILLGELNRIERHFTFVKNELPPNSNCVNFRLYTRLAVYGPVRVLEVGLLRFGFLSAYSLERVMELNFLIRNFDVVARYLDDIPVRPGSVFSERDPILDDLRNRSLDISLLAAAISEEVASQKPVASARLNEA